MLAFARASCQLAGLRGDLKASPVSSAAAAVGAKPPLQMQWSSQATESEAVWKNIYLAASFNMFVREREDLVVVMITVRTRVDKIHVIGDEIVLQHLAGFLLIASRLLGIVKMLSGLCLPVG